MADVKGILGRKVGMTQLFGEDGHAVPATILEAGPCRVAQLKTPERDGYGAIQLAFGERKKVNQPLSGHFAKARLDPARHLAELRIDDVSAYSVGDEIKADVFEAGEVVDVIGTTKGKGFAGGMKRHNFRGLPASHGTERKHRSPGSIGAAATPSRVFKGTKMAGHLGHGRVTTLNLRVVKVDSERNLLLVRGAVPGPKGGLVMIRSAVRPRQRNDKKKAGRRRNLEPERPRPW